MPSKLSQRTVYLVTAAIVAAMIGGFALADMSLGATNTSYQGSQTTTVMQVSGISYVSTNVSMVQTGATFGGCTTLTSPCDVHLSGYTLCVGGFAGFTTCTAGDFVEQVTLLVSQTVQFPAPAFGATPSGAVALTVDVTGSPGVVTGTTTYFFESALPPATSPEFIVLDFDVGTPSLLGSVTAITVIATA